MAVWYPHRESGSEKRKLKDQNYIQYEVSARYPAYVSASMIIFIGY